MVTKKPGGGSGPNLGEGGRGTPARFFKFLIKSILGRFSNMLVKCQLFLINLTG